MRCLLISFLTGFVFIPSIYASWEWEGDMSSLINAVIKDAENTMGKFSNTPPVNLKWCKQGPYYDIRKKTICFEPNFMRKMASIGDAAVAYVAAHEYAHHIVHSRPDLKRAIQGNILREELQADCFAGTILATIPNVSFDKSDLKEMLIAASLLGDREFDDFENHHGNGENRALALRSGFRFGASNGKVKDLYFKMFCNQS